MAVSMENIGVAAQELVRKETEAAREVGAKTLEEVRHAMRIDYFNDADLIAGK